MSRLRTLAVLSVMLAAALACGGTPTQPVATEAAATKPVATTAAPTETQPSPATIPPVATRASTATAAPVKTRPPSATPRPIVTRTVTAKAAATRTLPPPTASQRSLSLQSPAMQGDDVMELQYRLRELGYTEVGTPDGMFGSMTDQAVRHFQTRNGLLVDGVVGPVTWGLLFSADALQAEDLATRDAASPTPAPTSVPLAGFTLSEPIPVSLAPYLLTFDGTRLWAADTSNSMVQMVDPATGAGSAVIPLAGPPQTIVGDGARLWVMLPESKLQSVDAATGVAASPLNFGTCPECYPSTGLGFDGQYIWFGAGDDTVRALDPTISALTGLSRSIGWMSVGPMVFDGACMWVSIYDGSLTTFFDPRDGGQCPYKKLSWLPAMGAIAHAGTHVWVANRDYGEVIGLDLNRGELDYGFVVGSLPSALAWDGLRLWVANSGDNTLQAVDVNSGEVGPAIPVIHPNALAFDGSRLWLADVYGKQLQYLVVR